MDYGYLSQKLSAARDVLMLPTSSGEADSIVEAFKILRAAFHRMDESGLDGDARKRVRKLEELMNTAGLVDPDSVGLWTIKAQLLGTEEKLELSRCVEALAHWFRERQ